MDRKGGRRRRVVAGLILLLLLAGAACSVAWWRSAVPPSPGELLAELRLRHGIDLDRGRRGADWTYDWIATEWAFLASARRSLSPPRTPTSIRIRGWRCGIQAPSEVVAGAILLGSGTFAIGSSSTSSRRKPDGGFECETSSRIEEGPSTWLIVAVPLGTIERLRFDFP